MNLLLSLTTVALLLRPATFLAEELVSFRIIPIPREEIGYNTFESTIITTKGDFDAFLERTSPRQQMPWNRREDFEKALAQAKLDFNREALVLIRQTEGSGSVEVNFRPPRVDGTRVVCQIDRKLPGIETADMAYYCFALAVTTSSVTEVEIQVSGVKPIILSVRKEKVSTKPEAVDSK